MHYSPIKNDPLPLIAQAAFDLYGIRPEVDYEVLLRSELADQKGRLDGETTCPDNPNEIITVELDMKMPMVSVDGYRGLADTLAHELGHVQTGCIDEHGDYWGEVVLSIRNQTDKLYNQWFGTTWEWSDEL